MSKIIKGQENLSLETIVKIEEVLGVTLVAMPKNKIHTAAETRDKIKPIIYHSFEEKTKLEKDLMSTIPKRKRKAAALSLMSIFHTPGKGEKK